MTLVLLIPYNQGVLLISDRQSTRFDGTKESWDKIAFLEKLNAVIGLAANSSEAAKAIAQSLNLPSNVSLTEQYGLAYRKLSGYALRIEDKEIEALAIIKKTETIETYKFTRDIPELLSSTKPTGIGSGASIIRPHLDQNTNMISLEVAIDFGKTLIEYASRVSGSVGPPSQFGFNLGIVPLSGSISLQTLGSQSVSIEKIMYNFISGQVFF